MKKANLKIKVCGLKHMDNIREIATCSPDYMGFIFYPGSKRFAGDSLDPNYLFSLNKGIKKIGVFVNAEIKTILNTVSEYGLDFVQLHGDESPEFCNQLSEQVKIIKVFGVDEEFDFAGLKDYKKYSSFFLFDTKTKDYGGSGMGFNWNILKKYDNDLPFYLSGGIDLNHINEIIHLREMNLHAIDVNSKFETEPGLKDVNKIKLLIDEIHR